MIEIWGYSFRWLNILDVLIVLFLIYQLYRVLKGSIAFKIFWGIVVIYITYLIVHALRMPLLSTILDNFIRVGILAIIIIFQPEIRRFLLMLGENIPFSENNIWKKLLASEKTKGSAKRDKIIRLITMAVSNLANTYTGALIIITDNYDYKLKFNTSSGVAINGLLSARLLETIFKKNSPLHDGAVIISTGKIVAAKVVLPVSKNPHLPKRIGLRHRSGVGASEQSDALSIIVSEERGNISYAKEGELHMDVSLEELKKQINAKLSKDDDV